MQYEVIRSKRKTIGIVISPNGKIQVKVPFQLSDKEIYQVVKQKEMWILKHLEKIKAKQQMDAFIPMKFTEEQVKSYWGQAEVILKETCEKYSEIMGVTYNKITIRDQKTRWGSCSSKGNINLCWRLILMPQEILEYVVVHELAHRKQMNHSKLFWNEVEYVMPDYKVHRRWLKENGYQYVRGE